MWEEKNGKRICTHLSFVHSSKHPLIVDYPREKRYNFVHFTLILLATAHTHTHKEIEMNKKNLNVIIRFSVYFSYKMIVMKQMSHNPNTMSSSTEQFSFRINIKMSIKEIHFWFDFSFYLWTKQLNKKKNEITCSSNRPICYIEGFNRFHKLEFFIFPQLKSYQA